MVLCSWRYGSKLPSVRSSVRFRSSGEHLLGKEGGIILNVHGNSFQAGGCYGRLDEERWPCL
jgi:hypothetical protein